MTKLYNVLCLIAVILLGASCEKEKDNNFTLKGQIKDLKKGVVYLQKDGDSSIVTLDSLQISGQSEFELHTNLEEPILLYLTLQKNDGNDNYIPFFADKGITEITTTLNRFAVDVQINGSEQQKILEDYLELMSDFKDRNLELIKANFEALQKNDTIASDSIIRYSDRLQRLKYASTINFALNHNYSEVAPYLALYEIPNASFKYLDSIHKGLTEDIKKSYYGKTLGEAIDNYKVRIDSVSK